MLACCNSASRSGNKEICVTYIYWTLKLFWAIIELRDRQKEQQKRTSNPDLLSFSEVIWRQFNPNRVLNAQHSLVLMYWLGSSVCLKCKFRLWLDPSGPNKIHCILSQAIKVQLITCLNLVYEGRDWIWLRTYTLCPSGVSQSQCVPFFVHAFIYNIFSSLYVPLP